MPVYERGYTHWERSDRRADPPWWVIARRGIVAPLRSRWLLILLFLAWIPAIIKGTIIFVKVKTGDLIDLTGFDWASIEPGGFLAFIEGQRFFVFLFLAIVGTRLIAMDRRDNGLALYFSRPLGLVDYVLGKLLIVLFYYCLVTLAPVLVLCLFGYLVSSGATGLDMLLLIPLQSIVYCLFAGASTGLFLLALSSLEKRTIFITVGWTVVFIGSETISTILAALGLRWADTINFAGQYHNAASLLFGTDARLGISPGLSLMMILLIAAVGALILWRRVRPVEVVV